MAFNQPHLFRFTLLIDGVNHILKHSPDKWSDQSFEMSRDQEYFGVLKKFVTDLEFVKEEAKLLREKFYMSGVDGEASLRIEKLNSSTWEYYTIYNADIDFSTFEDQIHRVKTNLIDGGLTAKFQAYKNIKYEIDFKDEDPNISLGGVDIYEWANILAASFTAQGEIGNMAYYMPSTQLSNYSIVLGGVKFRDQTLREEFEYDHQTGDNSFIVAESFSGPIDISGYFITNYQQEANNGWVISIVDSTTPEGGNLVQLVTTYNTVPYQGLNERFDFSITLNAVAGVKYFLTVRSFAPQNFSTTFLDIIQSEIKVNYIQISDNAIIKAKRPKDLLLELLNLVSPDTENEVVSNLLDNNFNKMITSGDAIRVLPEAKIQTSLSDFFKAFHSVESAGLSIVDNTMIFEEVSRFYDSDTEIYDLGDVTDLKFMPHTDIMHSSIKAGYEKEDYEIERGREEFNNGQEWSTPIVRTQTELNLVSPYRADQYGIDELRIKQIRIDANAKDSDTSTDNDVFFVHTNIAPDETGIYSPIMASELEIVEGVSPRSTAYNFLLSPKRNLLRNTLLLKSMFYGDNNNGFIKFTSADKNAELLTKEFLVPEVFEREDIDISEISDRLYLPILAEFEAPYSDDLQRLIDLDRNGYITFSDKGNVYRGFLQSVDLSANKGGKTTFTLILTKDNILT